MDTSGETKGKTVAQLHENIPPELARELGRHCEILERGLGGPRSLRTLARQRNANVAVVDLDGVEERDREHLLAVTHELPELRLLLLGSSLNLAWVQRWITIGAQVYLHKALPVATVVREVIAPEHAAGFSIHLPHQQEPARAPAPVNQLSQREVQVLTLTADAMSNRQIARSLDITEGTVKRHMRNIFQKMDSHSRIDSVNKATALGLIPRERHPIVNQNQMMPIDG